MADFNMNDLLKSLPAEMQEKANACKNAEELLQFADENNIELPADALDAVSGGCGGSDSGPEYHCPNCGNEDGDTFSVFDDMDGFRSNGTFIRCELCGHQWRA